MFKEITLEIAGKRIYLILEKIAYKKQADRSIRNTWDFSEHKAVIFANQMPDASKTIQAGD